MTFVQEEKQERCVAVWPITGSQVGIIYCIVNRSVSVYSGRNCG